MQKPRSRTQKQPFNINISFNINPKNILQTQNNAHVKYSHHAYPQHSQSPIKAKDNSQQSSQNSSRLLKNVQGKKSKSKNQHQESTEMGKRQLDLLKKSFFSKINNIDIDLPPSDQQLYPQDQKQREERSSIMSSKMQEFPCSQPQLDFGSRNHNLHLDLHQFQEQKSKILLNHETSKVLGVQTLKKERKVNKKHSLSQTKQMSKWMNSQERQYPCLTERKTRQLHDRQKKQGKFRNKQEKDDTLKDKLQKFKVDMMKLALFYEENEVLRTKMSSQYYNMRSREISKDNVIQFTEGEEHEKIGQIRQFEPHEHDPSSQQVSASGSKEQINNFKQIYQKLKNVSGQQDQKRQSTRNIIDHYKTLMEKEVSSKKDDIKEAFQEEDLKLKEEKDIDKNNQKPHQDEENQLSSSILQKFIKFISGRYQNGEGKDFGLVVGSLVQEFMDVQEKQREENNINEDGYIIENDMKINSQLSEIPHLSKEILENNEFSTELILQLQKWEKSYTQQLLHMKSKMWREYRNIKNEIQSRISSGYNYHPIDTHKSRKKSKIMKCLSEKIMKNHFQKVSLIQERESLRELQEKQHVRRLEEHSLSGQERIEYFPENPYDHFQSITHHLEVQMSSEQDLSEQEFINSRVVFNQDKRQDILEEEESKDQKIVRTKDMTVSIKDMTIDDKEDIFQFIFLDLCIELYQDYVEKEGVPPNKEGRKAPAQKILEAIKKHIAEQKKRIINLETKKIGISTNINTIRLILKQLITFLTDQTSEKYSIPSRLLEKINSPLGPSETQMLKSLRISVLENQQKEEQDGDQEFQEDLLILQPDWFILFENQIIHVQQLNFTKYYESKERDEQRVNFLRNCTHIHHKAIFDCLNENLDYFRSFGLWGKPFAWKKKAVFLHQLRNAEIENVLNKAASEVLRSTTFACGLMANKEESLIKDIAGDEQYVRRLQDERIYKYLENFVMDLEEKWFFHDDEEAQVLIETSHIIWTILIKQVLRDITSIGRFRL